MCLLGLGTFGVGLWGGFKDLRLMAFSAPVTVRAQGFGV